MRFGLFGSAQAKRGGPDVDSGQGFKDYVDYNIEAEQLGYAATFVVEHHFTGFGQVSASMNLLGWVAAKTSTIRVGTAVMVLPWHNPILLAEQAATLDLLSGGRLEFGVGKGYRNNEFESFCIDPAEAEERFEESLGLIMKAFTSNERFSHDGKYWKFKNIIVEPPPFQKPHPRMWMAAGSPRSIAQVAERGFNLMLDQFASTEVTLERFNLFKSEVEKRGRKFDPMSVGVCRAFYVSRNAADKEQAVENRLQATLRMADLAKSGKDNKSSMMTFAETKAASEESALYGTPDEIAAKVDKLRKAGVELILLNGPGGSREHLRRFGRDVMPAFAGLPPVLQAAQ